jgi:predicted phosphodiesterase
VADGKFNEWIDLGDFLDLDFLSTHNIGKNRLNAGKLLKQHYAYGKEVLDRRLECLRTNNPKARMTMIEGNHDYRVEAYLDKNPEFEGLIEVEEGLGLQERGIEWVRFWRDGTIYKIGKAGFCHGLYTSRYHAAKMVENYCCNIFYGHVHDEQMFSKVMHGKGETVVGHALGCLCREDQSYIGQNPKNWLLAFGDFFFRKDGFFTYYVPKIFDGQFTAPSGKTYKGRTR